MLLSATYTGYVLKCGRYSITKFVNFLVILLRAEIVTTFESKMVTIYARNTIMRKFVNFVRHIFYIFQHFATKFWNLLLLKGSFLEFRFIRLDLSR